MLYSLRNAPFMSKLCYAFCGLNVFAIALFFVVMCCESPKHIPSEILLPALCLAAVAGIALGLYLSYRAEFSSLYAIFISPYYVGVLPILMGGSIAAFAFLLAGRPDVRWFAFNTNAFCMLLTIAMGMLLEARALGLLEGRNRWREEIDKYKNKCLSTKIWKGLEVDYIPGISDDFDFWFKNFNLDYLIGSVHLVENNEQLWFIDGPAEGYDDGLKNIFGNDMHLAVKSFYNQTCEMIESQKFDILGHCDKVLMHNRNRFITFDDEFYLRFLKETLMLAKEKNVIVEINTRGIYRKLHNDYYPGKYIFKFLKENAIRVIMSADGHKNDQINLGFEQLQNDLLLSGIHETWLPECMCKNPIPLIQA